MTPLQDIHVSVHIAAPPEVVWPYLVEEEHVPRWLGCLQYRKELGHVFYMQPDPERRAAGSTEGATHCALKALDAPRRLRFSWYLPGTPETEVTLEVEAEDGGSRVTLVHSGWDQFDPDVIRAIRDGLAGGWRSAVLPGLQELVEGREPEPHPPGAEGGAR